MPKEQKDRLVMTAEQFIRLHRIASGLRGFAVGMEIQDGPVADFISNIIEGIDITLREIIEEAEKRRDNHE